jgi:hypothetical protein
MKNKYFTLLALAASFSAAAQVSDSTELGAGYANQSFYSLENGEVANVDNNNWDIAFDLSGFGSEIRLNRRVDVMYVYPGDTANWATVDTAGHASWDSYLNGHESWYQGAFSAGADSGNSSDLGWGIYNTLSHVTEGDRIFLVELSNGTYRKLWVQLLASGVYTFKYDMIDNSAEQNITITKADYSGKNFIYYSLENDLVVDREPMSTDWDLVFTNYALELAPNYISTVTGVLHSPDCYVQEINNLPADEAVYADANLESNISTIGYDWKTFNFGNFSYDIEDSLSYFVQTAEGDVWQLVFTGFNGSVDGKSYFTKEQIGAASFEENEQTSLVVYPNPAINEVNVFNMENVKLLELYNMNGQRVFSTENQEKSNLVQIDLSALDNGIYLLNALTNSEYVISQKLVVTSK